MPSILFVCTANRIRSPLAEHLLRRMLAARPDQGAAWRVESAGTWTQPGLTVVESAQQVAEELGMDLSDHQSRSIIGVPLETFDLILTMERGQAEAIRAEFPELTPHIMTLGEAATGYAYDIPDPRGHTYAAVKACAREIQLLLDQGFGEIEERVRVTGDR
jgi:protein-tyrosine-phosphatase